MAGKMDKRRHPPPIVRSFMPTRLAEEMLTKAYEHVFPVATRIGSLVDSEPCQRLPVVNSECYVGAVDCHDYVTEG